jgi:hypothetical protein
MPYIAPDKRAKFDGLIDDLAKEIATMSEKDDSEAAFAGYLNYSCTRLALSVIRRRFGRIHYWLIAVVCGVFRNTADEFYRRVGEPYEDKQIAKSGDVDLYHEYQNEIEKS